MIKINWKDKRWLRKKGSQLFEELCYELIEKESFKNLQWREGSFDGGRDIQAEKDDVQFDKSVITQKYWFQCKRYASGVNLKHILDSLRQAEVEEVDYFVILTNSHLTPSLQDYIVKYNEKNKLKIQKVDHKNFEKLILKHEKDLMELQKYFEEDEQYEILLQKIKQKEEKKLEEFNIAKKELYKKISLKKYDESNVFKEVVSLSNQYLKLRFNKNALDLLKESENYLNDSVIKQQLRNEIGKIYLQLGRSESARILFAELLRKNESAADIKKVKILEFYYAKALFLCFDYTRSLHLFAELKQYFLNNNDELREDYLFAYVDLLIETRKYSDALKYLKLLKKLKTNFNTEVLYYEFKIYNKTREWKKIIAIYKKQKNLNYPKAYLWIKINYEVAFALWKNGEIEKAIIILEEENLKLIQKIGNEEDLMVLFQNLSKLKMEEEPFGRSSWDYYDKWLDLSEKIRNHYHSGIVNGLYSAEFLIENKFSDSLTSLYKSQRLFESIYSWTNIEQNFSRFGNLFKHSGNYLEAINYLISVADENGIVDTSKIIIEYYDSEIINKIFVNYLNKQVFFTSEKIGLCYFIQNTAEVLNEENLGKAFEATLKFSREKYSFTKQFDIQRPALNAIENITYLLDKNKKIDVYNLVKELYKPEIFWDVKEILSRILIDIKDYSFIMDITTELQYWSQVYTQEAVNKDTLLHNLEIFLYRLAKTNLSDWKEYLLNVFQKNKKFGNFEIAYDLQEYENEHIEKFIRESIERIKSTIVIDENITEDSPIERRGTVLSRHYIKDNRRIIVDMLNGLFPVHLLKNHQISNSLMNEFVLTIVESTKHKLNLLINREILLSLLYELEIPIELIDNIFDLLVMILTDKLKIDDFDNNNLNNLKNPFLNDKVSIGDINRIKKFAIYLCANNINKFNIEQADELIEKIKEYSNSESFEIKVACCHFFKCIEVKELATFFSFYKLLIDKDEDVKESIFYSFLQCDISFWDHSFYVEVVSFILNELRNIKSLRVRIACAKLLIHIASNSKHLLNDILIKKLDLSMNQLRNDKFYSVRNVFK